MNTKKIWFLLYVLVSLLANLVFSLSFKRIVAIGIGCAIGYVLVTEYFNIHSLDDVVDRGADVLDRSDEERLMQATLHRRQFHNQSLPTEIDAAPNNPKDGEALTP